VFERDNRLVTKIDLPGLKKEDVKVEVTDGYLAISGDRKMEAEEKKCTMRRRPRSQRRKELCGHHHLVPHVAA